MSLRRLFTRGRIEAGRAAPPAGTPRVPAATLRERLLALPGDNGPLAVHQEDDGTVFVTWQLHGIPFATLLFRAKLRETQALVLDLSREGTVRASARTGKIAWETAAATWMPRARVDWRVPWRPDFGARSTGPPPAIVPDGPRTGALLADHVRACVLAAGWSFEPAPG